ncbi:MAG: AAA family ATPase [Clostridia bacterium]|nr:AAA family ATPase [Clostridia bacterium]
MVVGARQIGKTYIIDEFCRKEFDNYIYINLFEREDLVKLFKTEISFEDKMKKFKYMIGSELTSDTIIFFDEIQESEELIAMLKSICESSVKYKVICAGSLLGVKLKRFKKSFPVGKVLIKHMYPMTFEEFLINTKGKTVVEDIYDAYENNEPLIDVLHEELILLYRIFLCVGGFPAAINEYIRRDSDIIRYNPMIIDSIYQSYLVDLNKYVENKTEAAHNEKVYKSIPSQLGKENKKFQYSVIEKGGRKNKFESSLDWLFASGIVIPVYFASDNQIPLKASCNDDIFKVYLNDPGLLTRVSDTTYAQIILDEDFRFKGAITENYVATELLANGHSLYY